MSGETLSTNTGESQEKVLDSRVESLAIPLARDYAEKNYPKREDGTFEPAWRGVNGEKELKNKSPEDLMAEGYSGLAAHEAVIDIANQPYNEYSEYWKEQNRGGAEFLIGLMDERGADTISSLNLSDENVRAEYGDLIHENWISRNEWVKDPNNGDPKLACSFADLDPVEQQKDIDQLGVLQEWITEQNKEQTQKKLEKALDTLESQLDGRQTFGFGSLEEWAKYLISDAKLDPDFVVENYGKIRDAVAHQQGSLEPEKKDLQRWEDGHDLLMEELMSHVYSGPKLAQEEIEKRYAILDHNYEERMRATTR